MNAPTYVIDTPDGPIDCEKCGDYLDFRWTPLERPMRLMAARRGVVLGVVLRDYMTALHAQGHKGVAS